MPKIPNTTARDNKPHPLKVGTLVANGICVGENVEELPDIRSQVKLERRNQQ